MDILLSFSATVFTLTSEVYIKFCLNTHYAIYFCSQLSSPSSQPRVDEYLVAILNETSHELLGQSFPGDGSSLSLDISSLQQCMSYTVSVTATNTGGSRIASAMLCELEPFECVYLYVYVIHLYVCDRDIMHSLGLSCLIGCFLCGWARWMPPGGYLCDRAHWTDQWLHSALHGGGRKLHKFTHPKYLRNKPQCYSQITISIV